MRVRLGLLLVLGLLLAVAAGCGGGEEVTPTPDNEATIPASTGGTDTGATETGGGEAETGGATETGGETETGGGGGGGGDAEAGKEVFTSAGCVSCHTLSDAGATGTVGPNLDAAHPSASLVAERVRDGKGVMPSFAGELDDAEIAAVAAYVSRAASG